MTKRLPVKVHRGDEREIILPQELAEELGLTDGDRLWAESDHKRVVLQRGDPMKPFSEFRDALRELFAGIDAVEFQREARVDRDARND